MTFRSTVYDLSLTALLNPDPLHVNISNPAAVPEPGQWITDMKGLGTNSHNALRCRLTRTRICLL